MPDPRGRRSTTTPASLPPSLGTRGVKVERTRPAAQDGAGSTGGPVAAPSETCRPWSSARRPSHRLAGPVQANLTIQSGDRGPRIRTGSARSAFATATGLSSTCARGSPAPPAEHRAEVTVNLGNILRRLPAGAELCLLHRRGELTPLRSRSPSHAGRPVGQGSTLEAHRGGQCLRPSSRSSTSCPGGPEGAGSAHSSAHFPELDRPLPRRHQRLLRARRGRLRRRRARGRRLLDSSDGLGACSVGHGREEIGPSDGRQAGVAR